MKNFVIKYFCGGIIVPKNIALVEALIDLGYGDQLIEDLTAINGYDVCRMSDLESDVNMTIAVASTTDTSSADGFVEEADKVILKLSRYVVTQLQQMHEAQVSIVASSSMPVDDDHQAESAVFDLRFRPALDSALSKHGSLHGFHASITRASNTFGIHVEFNPEMNNADYYISIVHTVIRKRMTLINLLGEVFPDTELGHLITALSESGDNSVINAICDMLPDDICRWPVFCGLSIEIADGQSWCHFTTSTPVINTPAKVLTAVAKHQRVEMTQTAHGLSLTIYLGK